MRLCDWTLRAEKPKDSRYPPEIQTLGDELRAKRLDLGLDQKEMARLLGVTTDSITYWETNRVSPSKVSENKIRKFLAAG